MRIIISIISLTLLFILFNKKTFAQPGAIDPSFTPENGPNGLINDIAVQSDGKIIIVGSFTTYNGVSRNKIARLNSDGSLDNSFNPGSGTDYSIYKVAIQSDGKILIGGYFNTYNGSPKNYLARLNSNGSIDNSFNPGQGPNEYVFYIVELNGGKILIGGTFTTYNGVSRNRIARLNSNGSLDSSFDPGSGANPAAVNSIAIQNDGKIIIGGGFTTFSGIIRKRVARLNINGSVDISFDPGQGANDGISSVAIDQNGKILVAGGIDSVAGVSRNGIARLNTDGSLDASFDPGTGFDSYIAEIVLALDGKILVGGNYTNFNGVSRNGIARLNPDGSLDTSFDPGTGVDNFIYAVAIQPNSRILYGGLFTKYNGISRNRIVRIFADNTTGVHNFQHNSGPLIFPNPNIGIIKINTPSNKGKLEIWTIDGRRVCALEIQEVYTEINLEAFNPGLYILKYYTPEQIYVGRFISK